MWQSLFFAVVSISVAVMSSGIGTEHPEDVVQVLTGTDTEGGDFNSDGNTLPQIKMPWGFNDWAPQTHGEDGAWWFQRTASFFQGMRCTHQPSPWIGDYGHFLLVPHMEERARPLRWSPDQSNFRPYIFNATLEGLRFELVPSAHAAIVRLRFPELASFARLSLQIGSGSISFQNDTMIQGVDFDNSGGVPVDWKGMFFTVQALSGARAIGQRGTFEFETGQGPAVVAVATSFVSQTQADLNLKQEVGSKSFQELLTEGRAKWAQQLGRVHVDSIDETQLAVFYTNLWKTMLFPRYLSEVNEHGEEVHRSPYTGQVRSGKLVADSGFWDSYRTVYQLQSLVFADNLGGLIDGWLHAYKEAKWLPKWASPGEHDSMVGTMADVTLADAIVKSKWGLLSGFDVNTAYEAIRKDAFVHPQGLFGRKGLEDYIDRGYVPSSDPDSVSRTLNYYVSDAAIARAANVLGKHEDEQVLRERSKRYNVIFNKKTYFFQPKDASGNFETFFDPLSWGNGFTEAGAWQYRFYLPHDVRGLEKLYDGKICDSIQGMMEHTHGEAYHVGSYGRVIHEMSELGAIHSDFGLYAHGNQPVHHILYVAKKAGCDDLADKYLRKVMQNLYTTTGWAGDEDNGEMASWYVLSALGVYSLEGARDELVLGSPAIKHATVQLPNNKQLIVETRDQADSNVYVQSVTWTPQSGTTYVIIDNVLEFTELMRGGTLTFKMGASPKATRALRATKRH